MSDKWCEYVPAVFNGDWYEFATDCGVQLREARDSYKFLNFCPNCGRRTKISIENAKHFLAAYLAEHINKSEERTHAQ